MRRLFKFGLVALVTLTCMLVMRSEIQAQVSHLERLQCLACHAGPDRIAIDPETGESRNVTIVMGKFHRADHGKMECMDCHENGFEQYPHVNMKTNMCMDCHPRKDKGAKDDEPYDFKRIQDEFENTVHFQEYKNKEPKCCGLGDANHVVIAEEDDTKDNQLFTCEHCHNPHYFEATKSIAHPQKILKNDNEACLRCHEPDASVILADPVKPTLSAVHDYLPHVDLHLESTRCIDCHTTVTETVAHDLPEGIKADQGCNSCHSVDTILANRLYRYVKESNALGFENSKILTDNYIMGAHRHRWADWMTFLLIGLTAVVIGIHLAFRAYFRRRHNSEDIGSSSQDSGAGT